MDEIRLYVESDEIGLYTDGKPGVTFTPSVSDEGVISWTNDGGLDNPTPVSIKGPEGESPQITVEDITGGHRVIFSYLDGSGSYVDIMNGTDGEDGITPSITATDITGGHRISVSYGTGDSRNFTVDVMDGTQGDPGPGIASGGTTGQVLKKKSATDYDTEWADASGGGMIVTLSYSNGDYSADKTYDQIASAIANDIVPIVYYNKLYYQFVEAQSDGYYFRYTSTNSSTRKTESSGFRIYKEYAVTYVVATTSQTVAGIPTLGNAGQALVKTDGNSYNVAWGGYTIPAGGNSGQVLAKNSSNPNDFVWQNKVYPSAYCVTVGNSYQKSASCTNFVLTAKSYLFILMAYDNTFTNGLMLNVNATGWKDIYINGTISSDTNYTLPAGTYIVYYDGTNYHFRTDGKIPNVDGGGGVFEVRITGSGSSRTSDKTPTEIKAAYDAGMTVVAYIALENKMAYPFTIGSVQVTFCSLPQRGLSNEYDSMMYYSYTITGINSTSVSVGHLSVTSAESLVGTVYPSAQYWFDWNEHGYQPVFLTQYDATQWSNFYYTGNMNHVGVLNFLKIDSEGNWTGTETYISRDVWQTEEYYEPYYADVSIGNIIFVKTEIDGNTLKTTEIYVKHIFDYGDIFIESRKVATCPVTVTTDYPQPYWPE